jgi:protein arginine N-methyltransferase 1
MPNDSLYAIADYGAMILDGVRMRAYTRALERAIQPGSVVADIGTGAGIFALLACRLGARRVYAIEVEDVIEVAREIAAANGYADRIEFIQAASTDVTLSSRADVIVSDLGGAVPWFRHHLPSIIDARRRLLAPGGVLIPRHDEAWAAVVEVDDFYSRWMGPWNSALFGFDMEAASRMAANTVARAKLTAESLLTDVRGWALLDYRNVEDSDARARLIWTVRCPGTGHGIAVGFHRTVADGICFSTSPEVSPESPATIYPTLFLPWPAPVALERGDVVTADLEARLVRSDYVWTWNTRVTSGDDSGSEKARFAQSTFYGAPLSLATLHQTLAT